MATKNPVGRPSVMTDIVLSKLEEAFAYGASDSEACFYANISHQTLYDYQKKHPEFIERKEALKEQPILQARETVVKSLTDPKNAQWYLERKRKAEFSPRTESEVTVGDPIKALLDKFGITEEVEGDRKDDGAIPGPSKSDS